MTEYNLPDDCEALRLLIEAGGGDEDQIADYAKFCIASRPPRGGDGQTPPTPPPPPPTPPGGG